MKSKNLILALMLAVIPFGMISAQEAVFVNMTEVTGADADGVIDPSAVTTPVDLVIPVRFTNGSTPRTAISNGFIFSGMATFSGITVAWNPVYPWNWELAFPAGCYPSACYPFFDQGTFINYFDDTLYSGDDPSKGPIVGAGIAGLTGAQGSGLLAGFDDVAITITVSEVTGELGDRLVMDSTWWNPANFWLWSGVAANVAWGGAYEFSIGPKTGVAYDNGVGIPNRFALNQNYPNPFNPTTTLSFDVPRRANVKIVVYNILGQPVRTLVDEELAAGSYRAEWDGTTEGGRPVASGVYLCNMQAGDFTGKVKMMMLK